MDKIKVTDRRNIVSAEWLNENLNHPDLIILDATMKHKPNGDSIESPIAFIPGALEFNFDTEICDKNSELPHMLPSRKQFEESARKLGVNNQSIIVVYDAMGVFSSPRAWWMFKIMGHQKVYVLDGGLPQWVNTEFPIQKAFSKISSHGNFDENFNLKLIVSIEQVVESLEQPQIKIIDARSKMNAIQIEHKFAYEEDIYSSQRFLNPYVAEQVNFEKAIGLFLEDLIKTLKLAQ